MMGKTLGSYEVIAEIGAGGMGTVYRGVDRRTNESVAIKHLKAELVRPELIERFKREGEALRQLNHPNIVKMLDAVEQDGQYYLIIEYLSGGDLNTVLKNGSLPVKQVLEISLDLADALTRAHRLNIIHRDLKPANILIAEDGTPRLTDFGVAHFGERERMTGTGIAVGTLDYLSPEALNGATADVKTDIWAAGVILFEMLAGYRPFRSEKLTDMIMQIANSPVPDLEAIRPDLPSGLIDLVYRMLAKNPDERIPSVRLIGAELESLLRGDASASVSGINVQIAAEMDILTTTPATVGAVRNNLPHLTTPFVGRENELQSLKQLLLNPSNQLVTLLGPGGMGKTRLSIETGAGLLDAFPDGVFFVELAPLESSDSIPMAVAEALGYPFQEDGRSPQQHLVDYFREKTQLLVLDNFEHVVEGRTFVQAVLQGAPYVKILVTSRTRLNLSGETVFQLDGMDFPDREVFSDAIDYAAVRLLLESARRVMPGFELSKQDLPYAARICRAVQGLPLALVLAGSWLELLTVQEIAEEIEKSIDFLETTMHDIPERQRTMRAVFEYSWKLLTDDERQVFARLAVFRGGMTREAAQKVADASLRDLQSLANKSILRRDSVTGRYAIHELLRQYGQEFLEQIGAFAATQQKHTAYYASFLAHRDTDIKGKRQRDVLHEIEADFENIKAAWRCACEQYNEQNISAMLETLYWFCIFRSRNAEGMDLFQMARQVWGIMGEQPILLAGRLAVRYPDSSPDLAETFERGLALAEQAGDAHEIAFCKRLLGHWFSHSKMDQDVGIPLLKASLAEYQALGDRYYTAIVLDDLGWSYNLSGKPDEHLNHVKQSLELRRQLGDKIGMTNALRNLGGATGGFGTTAPEPQQYWQEALQLAIEIDDRTSIAWNNYLLSAYLQYMGEFEKAQPLREAGQRMAAEINDTVILGLCMLSDAIDQMLLYENYERGQHLTYEGYPPNSPRDLRFFVFQMNIILLACNSRTTNNLKAAAHVYALRGRQWTHEMVAIGVFAAIAYYAFESRYEEAAETYGAFIKEPLTAPFLMLKDWKWFGRLQGEVEEALGQERFQAAVERGKALDLFMVGKEIFDELFS